MIKIDHARCSAVMPAVYLADNKHMVGKQMTAETEDHSAHSSNTLPRSYSRSTQLLAAG